MGGRIHVISCPDDFLLSSRAKQVVDGFLSDKISLEIVDGATENAADSEKALDSAKNALFQQDFFSSGKAVWLKNVKFFGTDRISCQESVKNAAAKFTDFLDKGIPDGTFLVISVLGFNKVLSTYKRIKELAAAGKLTLEEIPWIPDKKGADSSGFVERILKSRSWKMSPGVMRHFVGRVGPRPRVLSGELEKLFVYTNGAEPSLSDVDTVVTRYLDDEPWFFLDSFGDRDVKGAVKALHDLYEMKVSPVFLIIQLENRVNDMLLLQDAVSRGQMAPGTFAWTSQMSPDETTPAGRFGLDKKSPFALRRMYAQSSGWNRRSLRRARAILIKAHERIVSLTADDRVILEMAVIDAISEISVR